MKPVPLAEYEDFLQELRALLGQFRFMGEILHGDQGLSTGERTLLADLERHGPRSMPDLARARPVSRQHIQVLVRRLTQEGWITTRPNPAHRRSHLLELTPEGKANLEALRHREEAAMVALRLPFVPGELQALAGSLKHVREVLCQVFAKSHLEDGNDTPNSRDE